jgi:hypothetical protein
MRFCGVLMALWLLASLAVAQPSVPLPAFRQEPSDKKEAFLGFVDADRDGINDRFRDSDGDGRNDVNGRVYAHRFAFADQNKDRINDLFVDRDGDGVNDLNAECGQSEDGGCANVVDQDRNGVNDISGLRYTRTSLRGYRYGRIAEELRQPLPRFVDQDGDGMNDLIQRFFNRMEMEGPPPFDRFIDEDGDGINDNRPHPRPFDRDGMQRGHRPPPPRRPPPRGGPHR